MYRSLYTSMVYEHFFMSRVLMGHIIYHDIDTYLIRYRSQHVRVESQRCKFISIYCRSPISRAFLAPNSAECGDHTALCCTVVAAMRRFCKVGYGTHKAENESRKAVGHEPPAMQVYMCKEYCTGGRGPRFCTTEGKFMLNNTVS